MYIGEEREREREKAVFLILMEERGDLILGSEAQNFLYLLSRDADITHTEQKKGIQIYRLKTDRRK